MSRKKALAESRLGKYLVYALGEILLVVAGILIALQINTASQQRNQTKKTKTYLKSLNIEIQLNIVRLNDQLKNIQKDLENCSRILTELNSKKANNYDETQMKRIMNGTRPVLEIIPSTSSFDDLINSGALEYLENEKLKHDIIKMGAYTDFIDINFKDSQAVWDDFQLPYLMKHSAVATNWDSLNGVKIPTTNFTKDKDAFVHNRDYSNILALRMRMQANYFEKCEEIKKILEDNSVAINSYLYQ